MQKNDLLVMTTFRINSKSISAKGDQVFIALFSSSIFWLFLFFQFYGFSIPGKLFIKYFLLVLF